MGRGSRKYYGRIIKINNMNESKAKHYVDQQLAAIRTENKQLKNSVKVIKADNKKLRTALTKARQELSLLRPVKKKNK